jgi:hypothetical protein
MSETTISEDAREPLTDGVRRIETGTEQVVRDLGRMAEAWTAAANHHLLGTVRVLGDLTVNLLNQTLPQSTEGTKAVGGGYPRSVSGSFRKAAHDSARVASETLDRFAKGLAPESPPAKAKRS